MKQNTSMVDLYDTTLRDGNQATGISLSLSDKLNIAEKLSDIGMHYIEGGWPNPTNELDQKFYEEIVKLNLKSKIAVFGSTRRPGVSCEDDQFLDIIVNCNAPVATIFGKTWDLHVEKVIKTSLSENLDMISETVDFLKKRKDEVVFDAEHFFDGYLANKDYAIQTLKSAESAGADVIVLCDTNGGVMPGDFIKIFKEVSQIISTPLGVHMHNDTGCADANSFIGVQEGAVHVQGTMNGLGERCGNANLCTLIPGLKLKHKIDVVSDKQLKDLTSASIYISEIVNVAHNIRQPYVGEAAFSHKGGAHADGVRKVKESFEHIAPELVGNFRRFVVSDQAGKSTILERLNSIEPNLSKSDPRVKELLGHIKKLESNGYQFEAADGSFELISRKTLGLFEDPFSVIGFRVIEEKRENGEAYSEATIKIKDNGVIEHTVAEGDGPVNALDNAVKKALIKFYPNLKDVRLEDFKVRVLNGSDGTDAKVRVLIESSDGEKRWNTIGVSTNIIEASWIALIDGLKYKLMKDMTLTKGHK